MQKMCDLHTHSIRSDGTYTPTEIVKEAVDIGLSAVALCDHNTIDGVEEFLSAAEGKHIEAIAGIEISVDFEGKELHLLGLYIPPESFEAIVARMKPINEKKEKSNIELVKSLCRAGYALDYSEVKEAFPMAQINRANIANVLVAKGYVKSVKEAFKTLLGAEHGHYRETERPDAHEMIAFLKKLKAVPVLAHPLMDMTKAQLEKFLPVAVEAGLVGMECYYSEYTGDKTADAIELADRFALKYSGGSDFHGNTKPHIKLGVGMGNLCIPHEWAESLKCK